MKKIISILMIVCVLLSFSACNGGLSASVSQKLPSDKKIIEVEAEDFGYNVYFEVKNDVKNVSVNKMIYDDIEDSYSVDKTVYKANKLKKDECLKIILDLEQEIPYVMVKYTAGKNTYQQYLYMNEDGKILLLERE